MRCTRVNISYVMTSYDKCISSDIRCKLKTNPESCLYVRCFCSLISVCAFPYIMAFTPDTIEIRLIINGNLLHTMTMPKLFLISSKVCMNLTHF